MFTAGAMSLAVFDIPKVVGNSIEINPASSSTITGRYVTNLITSCVGLDRHNSSHLKPFKCSTKPRFATAVALIEQNVDH
jgi:hypothetical protein